MTSACPPAQLSDGEGSAADADGPTSVGLAVGLAGAVPDADVDAPVDGVAEPLPDGPPDEPPHATRTTAPAITHPPAHHRIRTPPGPAPTDTSMPHSATRPTSARARGAHPPPITAMLETTEHRRRPNQGTEAVTR
ncbi:hypothetical protein [Streptomyces sp. NPDC006335]|uniref:hypothetical protein n=1 Tax=Streptomyces sp. NPDC006335 TaxID=3156895 RepID=UPI0033B3D6C9